MFSVVRKSIALKVIVSVGTAMTVMFVLQSYINISNFQKLVQPLIMRDLDNSLLRSKIVFDNIYQQTVEDAHIIRSHNSLTNYLDYEQLEYHPSLNDKLLELEQFLSLLTASKPRYHDVEVVTEDRSIIRLLDGVVVESDLGSHTNDYVENAVDIEHHVYFEVLPRNDKSDLNNLVLLNLDYKFLVGNQFINGEASKAVIRISNKINQPLEELITSLKSSNIVLSVLYKEDVLAGDIKPTELDRGLWLTKQFNDLKTGLTLAVSIKKTDAFLLVDEMQRSIILLAISLLLVMGVSQLVTIRILIAKPLQKIIRFINERVLQSESELVHYKTNSKDEIGVFAQGLNQMLDQIQNRELALRNSEERLGMALWGSGEGLWEYRLINGAIYLDNMSCRILGLTNHDITTDLNIFSRSIHLDDRARVEKYFSDFSNQPDYLFEIEFRVAKQNNYNWLQLRGKLVDGNDENIANKTVLGTFRNITEYIESEEQIRLYAKAFDSSSSAILILDKKLVVLAANGAFSQITGFNFSDVVGRIPDFIIDADKSSFNISDFTHNIDAYGKWQNELMGTKFDGSKFVQDISINVILDSDQSPSHYVCAFTDITQKKKSEEDLWDLANHDILTGLPNRGYFRKTLDKALNNAVRTDGNVVLLFIDLDRFKQVNDTLGHETGDELLKKVARILSKVARKSDYAARLGGDEFAIILEDVTEKKYVERIAKNLVMTFSSGLLVDDKDTGVGLSIGISIFPTDTDNSDDLIHFADTAMYFSKTYGTNQYHFFNPSMSDHVNRRNLLEKELRAALQDDALSLYFQPQIDIESGKIVGFEALSRWFHPELGTITPDEFIPIAEDAGLIVQLGQQVLLKACKQVQAWHNKGYDELRVAINVSAKQFLLSDVALDVTNALEDVGLEAKYIELELTESLIVDDPEKIIGMLNKLKKLGVKLSIDDFGTGYSSLSYLSRFPLDVLKIDKSFINQLTTDEKGLAITQAIIAIALTLQLDVIAEGVENEKQLDILRRLNCKCVQGYYFGKPISAQDTLVFLKDHNQFDIFTAESIQT
ncbi:MAG: diguanylate cyclase (GGDEF)-like protein/PAS domain S-box-containing protein [Flavobacteriales bacterium]|jgi:diguanylate cyclase (GGDEF)-like protein/PAS domain S-box-containing protein